MNSRFGTFLLARVVPALLALPVLALRPFAQEAHDQSGGLTGTEFRREFEAASDAEQWGSMERLVRQNPTLFLAQFREYVHTWMDWEVEPEEKHLHALGRAWQLTETVDLTLGAPGLLHTLEAMEALDEASRAKWRQARAWSQKARDAMREADWKETLPEHQEALTVLLELGDLDTVARMLSLQGSCHESLGQYQLAIDLHQRGLALREEIGDPLDVAASLTDLGSCYYHLDRFAEATDLHKRTLAIVQELGDIRGIAASLDNLGLCYRLQDQPRKAIEFHQQGLAFEQETQNRHGVAVSLGNLAICYDYLGQFKKAIELHQQALAVLEEIGDPPEIAQSLHSLGNCYAFLGNLEKAIKLHRQALTLRERFGNPQGIANTLTCLGNCYRSLGQHEKAIEFHKRALALSEEAGSTLSIGLILTNLGSCYQSMGQCGRAIPLHNQSLSLMEKIGNLRAIATSLMNLGCCHASIDQQEKAIEFFGRSLAIDEAVGNPQGIAKSLMNLGSCHASMGQREKAISLLVRALALSEEVGNPLDIATSLKHLGVCYKDLHRFDEALPCLLQTAVHLARVSRRTLSERGRVRFESEWMELPAHISECVVEAGSANAIAAGFSALESLSGRALLEGLHERLAGALEEEDPELGQQRREVMARMECARLNLARAVERRAPDKDQEELSRTLHSLQTEFEELEEALRRRNPRLAELISPRAVSIKELQREVLGEGEVMLRYVLGRSRSYLWVITLSEAHLRALPGVAELQVLQDALLASFDADRAGELDFVGPARELYRALVGPAEPWIQTARAMIIIPDCFLGQLPFETLLTRDVGNDTGTGPSELPFLLHECSVLYAPSASLLAFQTRSGRRHEPWKKDLLLLGDPLFPAQPPKPNIDSASGTPDQFQRLSGSRTEVLELAASVSDETEMLATLGRSGSLHGRRFDLYLGEEASESRLSGDLRGYRILHLATHGYYDPEQPWFSGLMLGRLAQNDPGGPGLNGFLTLPEIARLKLDAELVFLSACDTARGELWRSEGIRNAARSFLLAGARAVIATQWQVDDRVAVVVAREFYRNLFQGVAPTEALRQAKLALLDRRVTDLSGSGRDLVLGVQRPAAAPAPAANLFHPTFWGPFVMFGGR